MCMFWFVIIERDEEERIVREKREKEEAEYNEKARKLAEIEEKKRQRELEIEEKLRRKNEDRPRYSCIILFNFCIRFVYSYFISI